MGRLKASLSKLFTPRTDNRLPLHDLDLSRHMHSLLPTLYYLAHVAWWDPYICMIYSRACFLGWMCTMQILHNLSQRQVELDHLDHDLPEELITNPFPPRIDPL